MVNETSGILASELAKFSNLSIFDLTPFVERQQVETFEVGAESGNVYQLEIQFCWDNVPGGAIRVLGSIDNKGRRSLIPLTDSFVIFPEPA
jgi:hypothetical protein